jgi:hypothetical protein
MGMEEKLESRDRSSWGANDRELDNDDLVGNTLRLAELYVGGSGEYVEGFDVGFGGVSILFLSILTPGGFE